MLLNLNSDLNAGSLSATCRHFHLQNRAATTIGLSRQYIGTRAFIDSIQIQYGDVPKVAPGPGKVKIKVRVCALNHLDIWVRKGWPALKLEMPHWCGADGVIDRSQVDWGKEIYRLTGRRGIDVIVDNVGKATLSKSMMAAARGGRIVIVGNASGYDAEIEIRLIFSKQINIIGSTMGTHQDFRCITGLLWDGQLKPVIDRVMPLSQ